MTSIGGRCAWLDSGDKDMVSSEATVRWIPLERESLDLCLRSGSGLWQKDNHLNHFFKKEFILLVQSSKREKSSGLLDTCRSEQVLSMCEAWIGGTAWIKGAPVLKRVVG